MSQWISVEERLPEIGPYMFSAEVLVSDGRNVGTASMSNGDNSRPVRERGPKWHAGRYQTMEGVTHWMPLPEPPR